MLKLTKQELYILRPEDLKNFPRQELRKMDQLWVKYSNGKFGFSVQKQIWLDLGGKLDGEPDWYGDIILTEDTFTKLGDRVGWRNNDKWLSYNSYTFSTNALRGHLPTGVPATCAKFSGDGDKVNFADYNFDLWCILWANGDGARVRKVLFSLL
jgi:hypothetical protein